MSATKCEWCERSLDELRDPNVQELCVDCVDAGTRRPTDPMRAERQPRRDYLDREVESVTPRAEAEAMMHVGRRMDVSGGDWLVLQYQFDERYFDGSVHPGGTVLAFEPSRRQFVTWWFTVREGQVVASTGIYSKTLDRAMESFNVRVVPMHDV